MVGQRDRGRDEVIMREKKKKLEWPELENDKEMEKIRHDHHGSPICLECAYLMLRRVDRLFSYESLTYPEKISIIRTHRRGTRNSLTRRKKNR